MITRASADLAMAVGPSDGRLMAVDVRQSTDEASTVVVVPAWGKGDPCVGADLQAAPAPLVLPLVLARGHEGLPDGSRPRRRRRPHLDYYGNAGAGGDSWAVAQLKKSLNVPTDKRPCPPSVLRSRRSVTQVGDHVQTTGKPWYGARIGGGGTTATTGGSGAATGCSGMGAGGPGNRLKR